MEKASSRNPMHAFARVLALALFLTGTNYCLVNLIPGAMGCGMATAAPRTPARPASSCGACPSSRAASSTAPAPAPKNKPASTTGTLPCCASYAPVTSPDAGVSASKTPTTLLLSLIEAPAAKPASRSASRAARSTQKKPAAGTTVAPPPGRAPPIF